MAGSRSRWISSSLLGAVLLAGCGTGAADSPGTSAFTSGGGPTSPSSSTNPSTSPAATSGSGGAGSSTPSVPMSPSVPKSSAGDITLKGSVSGAGLTCVSFEAENGARYALGGPGLPGKLVAVAHSFGQRSSLKDQPSRGQTATVTLTGHVVRGAMSTCNLTTFSVTSAQIQSISPQ